MLTPKPIRVTDKSSMHTYSKKLVGTSAVLLIAIAGIISASPEVFAKFVNFGSYYTADGTVTAVGASTITIDPGTDNTVTLVVNAQTRFAKQGSIADIEVGDTVRSKFYSSGGQYLAQTVSADKGNYGNVGERTFVQWAYVTAKTANTFTVQIRPSVYATFTVTPGTKFSGHGVNTFAKLNINDTVKVKGNDSGSGFVATKVTVEQHP